MAEFPPIVEQLISVNPRAYEELVPTSGPSPEARKLLESVTIDDLFTAPIVSHVDAYAALAGLWLWNDGLEECHQIVQQSPEEILAGLNLHGKANGSQRLRELTATLAYWHGIMHRREPDFGNSNYWFRRAGRHPAFASLPLAARALVRGQSSVASAPLLKLVANESWDPFLFVDVCEQVARGDDALSDSCRAIAHLEWRALFEHCYRRATDESGSLG